MSEFHEHYCKECHNYAGDDFGTCKVCDKRACNPCLEYMLGSKEELKDRVNYKIDEDEDEPEDGDKYRITCCSECETHFYGRCKICTRASPETREKKCSECNGYVCPGCAIPLLDEKIKCVKCARNDIEFRSFLLYKAGFASEEKAMESFYRPSISLFSASIQVEKGGEPEHKVGEKRPAESVIVTRNVHPRSLTPIPFSFGARNEYGWSNKYITVQPGKVRMLIYDVVYDYNTETKLFKPLWVDPHPYKGPIIVSDLTWEANPDIRMGMSTRVDVLVNDIQYTHRPLKENVNDSIIKGDCVLQPVETE